MGSCPLWVSRQRRADVLAKKASSLLQDTVPADVRPLTMAAGRSRTASRIWRRRWPDNFFRRMMKDRSPRPVFKEVRDDAENVHQVRAGHWNRSRSYLRRIGRLPSPVCQQCPDLRARRHSAQCAAMVRHAGGRSSGVLVPGGGAAKPLGQHTP